MEKSRREFIKEIVAGTMILGAASMPQSLSAMMASPADRGRKKVRRPKRVKCKRVVLLSLDGISVPGFQKARTPNIDALLAEGVLSVQTRVVMPSVTLPNWTSHLTGSGPEQHGVVGNDWRLDNIKLPAVAKDADGYYPSIFKVLKDAVPGMKTAYYWNWKELINTINRRYLDEASFLEDDAYVPNYGKALEFIKSNRDNPTLVFLYSVHTDHAGHRSKWMSPEYIASIEEADVEIGRLLEKMKAEGLYDSTHFFFLSDHGGINYGHGGVTPDEMIVPWGLTGPGIAQGLRMDGANNTVNTAAVIAHLFGVEQPDEWVGEVPACLFR